MALNTYDVVNAAALGDSLPSLTQAYYDRKLLERSKRKLVHDQYGQMRPMKRKSGNQIMFRRWEKLAQNVTELQDGVTPTGKATSHTNVVATIKQYGDFVKTTDRVGLLHPDDVVSEHVSILSTQMGESMDSIVRDIINAGTNFIRSTADGASPTYGAGARSTVNGCITKLMLDQMITTLQAADAEYPEMMIGATTKVATEPVGESYVAIIHPYVAHDLVQSASGLGTDFVPVEKYASTGKLLMGEVGKYRNVRFVMSTNAKGWLAEGGTTGAGSTYRSSDSTNVDVYSVLMIGRNAYGVVPLPGASKTIVKGLGSAGTADPLNQRATVGWVAWRTAAILNDNYMVRGEVAVRR